MPRRGEQGSYTAVRCRPGVTSRSAVYNDDRDADISQPGSVNMSEASLMEDDGAYQQKGKRSGERREWKAGRPGHWKPTSVLGWLVNTVARATGYLKVGVKANVRIQVMDTERAADHKQRPRRRKQGYVREGDWAARTREQVRMLAVEEIDMDLLDGDAVTYADEGMLSAYDVRTSSSRNGTCFMLLPNPFSTSGVEGVVSGDKDEADPSRNA
ncbi:hypothetical protein OF83DRAFT_1085251 [Amylostereum chailletii]|nr:hypothetical protein OF83DRAFT_1085251 [Amylostereum chailletii]